MTTETITHSIDAPEKALGMDHDPDPEIPAKARRRQYSARYKAETLAAYDKLPKAERGAFLRREGLYSSNITEWRHQRDRGALEALAKPVGRPVTDPKDREVATLRKENERLSPRAGQGPQDHRGPGESSRRCWSSSPPTAPSRPARRDDRPGHCQLGPGGGHPLGLCRSG